jgi:AraC-like DNA-binding protein
MPPLPALIRPRPFEGEFGPFVTVERSGGREGVLVAVERFAAQPGGVQVANPALRICRHLDAPLRFQRQARGTQRVEEFIAPGQHFVFGAEVEARFAWDTPFRTLSLTIGPELLRQAEPLWPEGGVTICAEDPVLEHLTALALLDAEEGFPRGELFAEGLGLAAAAHLMGCGSGGRRPLPPGGRNLLGVAQLRALREAVEATLPDKPSLASLSEAARHPAHRLGAAFRRSTGMALWDYVASRRLALAETLLRDPTLSLGAVAFRAGYSSQAHLTTAFRRFRGTTPSAWRKLGAR